jgi:aryl carrier-like protein
MMASSTDQGVAWLRRRGLNLLSPALALDAMEILLVERVPLAAIADVDWTTFRFYVEAQRPCPWLEHLGGKAEASDEYSVQGDSGLSEEMQRLRSASETERTQLLAAAIRAEVVRVLGVGQESFDDKTSMLELGLDSLMAVDLINRLRRRLRDTRFSPRLIYENPTVTGLATALAHEMANVGTEPAHADQAVPSESDASPQSAPGRLDAVQYRMKSGELCAFRRYREGDKAGILSSYERCFGHKTAHVLERVFDWKYLDSPLAPNHSPVVDLLESDGRIVGMNGAICVRFKLREVTLPGVWSLDSHVVPDYREISSWFMHQVHEEAPGIVLGIPNASMYPFLSATETVIDLDRYSNLRACIGLGGVLEARGWNRLLSRICGLVFWPVPRLFELYSSLRVRPDTTVGEIPRFDARFDQLWELVSRDYPGIMVRDHAFLSWRFDRFPGGDYTRYVAERDGSLVGYMVTRTTGWRGTRRGRIVDFLVAPNDSVTFDSLLKAVMRDFRIRGIVAVSCSVSSTQSQHIQAMRRQGFLHVEPGPHVIASRGRYDQQLAAVDNWFFTTADGDSDFNEDEESA